MNRRTFISTLSAVSALAVLPTAIVMGVLWEIAKYLYILALPHLDFRSIYGPFEVSVGLNFTESVTLPAVGTVPEVGW